MISRLLTRDRGASENLVCTVTTVKDRLSNIEAFVRRNLAAGVDHMFLFIDDADPEIHAALADHPHVSAVRTGKRYWQGRRPGNLNTRQAVNANLAQVLLTPFPEARWLFHIDGDECLDVDKEALLALDDTYRAVQLRTLEAVAQMHWDGPVTHFKRPLDDDELQLLAALGVIDKPSSRRYFNGHQAGKPGVAPGLDLHLRIHYVEDEKAERVEAAAGDTFSVLHYESYSGEEFVRKWAAHLSEAETPRFSGHKDRVRAAISSILANPNLDEALGRELLMQVYRRNVEDDLAALVQLGYAIEPDRSRHGHEPSTFRRDARTDLEALLRLLALHPEKECLVSREGISQRPWLLQELRGQLDETHTSLARRIDGVLERGR